MYMGGTPYLHLFHEFKHLLRWQTGYCSADGLWGLLWLDAVSIRRLNNGGSCSQTCARQIAWVLEQIMIRSLPKQTREEIKNLLFSSSLFFSLAALSTRRARPLNSLPFRFRMALRAVSWSWYSQKPYPFGFPVSLSYTNLSTRKGNNPHLRLSKRTY